MGDVKPTSDVRKERSAVALLAGSAFLVMSPAVPAGAAGGYPPPTIAGTSCSTAVTIIVGTTKTVTVTCNFAPGSTITVTLNGAAYCTLTAPASGILVETFTLTPSGISLNGCPVVAAAAGGTLSFVASGTNPAGGTNVATTLVEIPAALISTTSPVAFTGADLAAIVGGGIALLALGFGLVVFTRRRHKGALLDV